MAKIILTKDQIFELVTANLYKVQEKNKFLSRCIDGRYANSIELNPLAVAGADAGELAMLYATANQYGFSVDEKKAFEVLLQIVGKENFAWHSDKHAEESGIGAGCGHLTQIRQDPQDYHLEKDQLKIITQQLKEATELKSRETVLNGDHKEGAIIQISGNYSVMPQYTFHINGKDQLVQVFVHHKSLADERRKHFAQKLIESNAVVLYDNLDQEYLYEVMTDTAEEHLFETAKRLATGLPLYGINFDNDGSFKIADLGII